MMTCMLRTHARRGCIDTLDAVLHLRFRTPVQVQEGLLQAEIQKEEEEDLPIQRQVHLQVREGLPTQVRVLEELRLSSPERLV